MCFVGDVNSLKWTPKHSAEVMPRVPKCKKAVMCLMEKMHLSDKLPSSMRCMQQHKELLKGGHLSGLWVEHVTQPQGYEFRPILSVEPT